MSLDARKLASQMLAALPILKKNAEDAESFAAVEFKKIGQTIVSIEEILQASRSTSNKPNCCSTCRRAPRAACYLP